MQGEGSPESAQPTAEQVHEELVVLLLEAFQKRQKQQKRLPKGAAAGVPHNLAAVTMLCMLSGYEDRAIDFMPALFAECPQQVRLINVMLVAWHRPTAGTRVRGQHGHLCRGEVLCVHSCLPLTLSISHPALTALDVFIMPRTLLLVSGVLAGVLRADPASQRSSATAGPAHAAAHAGQQFSAGRPAAAQGGPGAAHGRRLGGEPRVVQALTCPAVQGQLAWYEDHGFLQLSDTGS